MRLPEAADVLALARTAGMSLGSAESLTGGAVSAAMTAVAGSSDVWRGAIVAYHSDVKESLLNVPHSVLEHSGPASADTALAMAHGARALLSVDIAVSTTGVAGPQAHGGQAVGSVFVAAVGPGHAHVREFHYAGDREAIVRQAVDAALAALFAALDGHSREPSGKMEQV